MQHCKYLFCFSVVHFNSFLNNYLFVKFINKWQKEFLRCAPFSTQTFIKTFTKLRTLVNQFNNTTLEKK